MTRFALFVAAVAGVVSAGPSRADVAVAPPPREVRPDGSRDPAPEVTQGPKENPAEVVDRIIKNSKAVGDRLAMTDTGKQTRTTQDKILKDIDALLDQDNPPPKSGGDSGNKNDQDKNKDQKNKDQKNNNDPAGGMNNMQKKGDMPPPMGGMQPTGGDDNKQASGGHRPRPGQKGQEPKQPGKQPAGAKQDSGMAKARPSPGKTPAGPKGSQKAGGGPGNPTGKMAAKPSLPIDDDVVKEVWGHLPDKLRQQVTQYYKEEFMPRYAGLLKQYYSSLANTPQKPDERK